jgi:hypothetical protein
MTNKAAAMNTGITKSAKLRESKAAHDSVFDRGYLCWNNRTSHDLVSLLFFEDCFNASLRGAALGASVVVPVGARFDLFEDPEACLLVLLVVLNTVVVPPPVLLLDAPAVASCIEPRPEAAPLALAIRQRDLCR